MEKDKNLEIYFDEFQLYQIKAGFEDGLDINQVRYYARNIFSYDEMEEIRVGFESGLGYAEVDSYADTDLDNFQMAIIRTAFERGFWHETLQKYLNFELNKPRYDLTDTEILEKAELPFDEIQMKIIEIGCKWCDNIDYISYIANPELSPKEMKDTLKEYVKDIYLEVYLDEAVTEDEDEDEDEL